MSIRQFAPTVLLILVAPLETSGAVIDVRGGCTLVDAIHAANTDLPAGGCPGGSGADVIRLSADVVLDTVDNSTLGDNGLPLVRSELEIDGRGFSIARSTAPGTPGFRILHVSDARLTLREVTISNGAEVIGAAIFATGAFGSSLVILDSVIVDNQGPAIEAFGGADDELTLASVLVSRNLGLAVHASGDLRVSVVDCAIRENENFGPDPGGGIYSAARSTLIKNTVISENIALQDGGGVYLDTAGGDLSLFNSTLSDNFAPGDGGGLFNGSALGSVAIVNSTVSGNSAAGSGGGIATAVGSAGSLEYTTILDNSAAAGSNLSAPTGSEIGVTNSIVAAARTGVSCDGAGIVDRGGNFDDDGSCPGAPITIGVDIDPLLAPNGNLTATHALLPGSVAVDFSGDCVMAHDQRGWLRDGNCDGGAFELGSQPIPTLTLVGTCPGRVTLAISGLTPGEQVSVALGLTRTASNVPNGPCAGTPLEVSPPALVGTGTADTLGLASQVGSISAPLCGAYLQAIDLSSCATSTPVQIPAE